MEPRILYNKSNSSLPSRSTVLCGYYFILYIYVLYGVVYFIICNVNGCVFVLHIKFTYTYIKCEHKVWNIEQNARDVFRMAQLQKSASLCSFAQWTLNRTHKFKLSINSSHLCLIRDCAQSIRRIRYIAITGNITYWSRKAKRISMLLCEIIIYSGGQNKHIHMRVPYK